MTHSDPDVLAMMAMGESGLPEADVRHIQSCDDCRSDLRSLRRVAELARSGEPHERFPAPAPAVWDRIVAELRLDPVVSTSPAASGDDADIPAAPDPAGMRPRAHFDLDALTGGDPGLVPGASAGAPRHRPAHRRRARRVVAITAAAALAAAAATVAVVQLRPNVLAETELAAVSDAAVAGTAAVESGSASARDLAVTVSGDDAAPADGTYREVWLISPELDRLISLGVLQGDEGRFAVPEGVDLAQYPVVDVSVEPLDGDPAHSGDSILRGTLPV